MSTVLQATGIDHVVLHVRDLERSKKFYVDLLGMTVDRGRGKQAFLRCGAQQIGLFETEDGSDVPREEMNHMALNLAAGEVEHVRTVLEQAGFQPHGRDGDPRCVYVRDPDGHHLQLLTPGRR
ncbi:MAG: VOC family protein [Chloroflexota bacterium]